jgi:hypothetical protein
VALTTSTAAPGTVAPQGSPTTNGPSSATSESRAHTIVDRNPGVKEVTVHDHGRSPRCCVTRNTIRGKHLLRRPLRADPPPGSPGANAAASLDVFLMSRLRASCSPGGGRDSVTTCWMGEQAASRAHIRPDQRSMRPVHRGRQPRRAHRTHPSARPPQPRRPGHRPVITSLAAVRKHHACRASPVDQPQHLLPSLTTYELRDYRRRLESAIAFLGKQDPVPPMRDRLQGWLDEVLAEQDDRARIAAGR